jgi:hypothetical protein
MHYNIILTGPFIVVSFIVAAIFRFASGPFARVSFRAAGEAIVGRSGYLTLAALSLAGHT